MASTKYLSIVFTGEDRGATKAFRQVDDAAENTGSKLAQLGSRISPAVAAASAAVVAGVGFAMKAAFDAATESAVIARETERVIQTTGASAWTTADQISDLATSVSNLTGKDDELIQSSANLLLTFAKVRNEVGEGNDIFDQAVGLSLDLSVALGTDASSASIQLGKALNDPVKGITALSRAGVSFTAEQKEQIKTLVATGDTLSAQKVILGELKNQFGGAAEAAKTPIEALQTKLGNLQESIGTTLMPTIGAIADAVGVAVDSFNALPDPVKNAVLIVTGVGTAALAAIPLVAKIAETFSDVVGPAMGMFRRVVDSAAIGVGELATKLGASRNLLAVWPVRLLLRLWR
jgi:phage-related minor tail protein